MSAGFRELGGATVIGIDASSKKVAWRVFTSHSTEVGTTWLTKPSSAYAPANAAMVLRTFPKLFKHIELRDAYVYIEAPLGSPKAGLKAALPQAYVNGTVQAFFTFKGSIVEHAYVQQWKKLVIGRGNATKDQVAETLRLRWPALAEPCGSDQDLIDSTAIALYGVGKLCGEHLVEETGGL